jgi:hypothetical protein
MTMLLTLEALVSPSGLRASLCLIRSRCRAIGQAGTFAMIDTSGKADNLLLLQLPATHLFAGARRVTTLNAWEDVL